MTLNDDIFARMTGLEARISAMEAQLSGPRIEGLNINRLQAAADQQHEDELQIASREAVLQMVAAGLAAYDQARQDMTSPRRSDLPEQENSQSRTEVTAVAEARPAHQSSEAAIRLPPLNQPPRSAVGRSDAEGAISPPQFRFHPASESRLVQGVRRILAAMLGRVDGRDR